MFIGGLLGLLGSGKMDIAILKIDRRPIGLAIGLQGVPLSGTEYFVN
jgi:hypothetical protein